MRSFVVRIVGLGLLLMSLHTSAQSYFYNENYYDSPLLIELGVNTGVMNCFTDLGAASGINWKDNHFTAGLYAGILYNDFIGAHIEANLGKLSASDIAARNLSFKTDLQEALLIGEIHPLYRIVSTISPYLLAGIGTFKFHPAPLYAEGKSYKLQQMNIPIGGGVRIDASHLFSLRLEGVYRILTTDHLDDVSIRGNPKVKDAYFSLNVKLGLIINRERR